MKKRLIRSQKKMFDDMKAKAMSYEYEINESIESYGKDQVYYSERDFTDATMKDLIRSIQSSQVTYLGDFHTYDQNARNLIRIIRSLLRNKRSFVVGLEMVHQKDQGYLDAYLQGFLTELEFLESIQYSESWRFPWNHYRILFDMAMEHEIEVIALNGEGSLEERDEFASDKISDFIYQNPNIPMLVLYGELHILPNKIPKLVKIKTQGMKLRQTIIHQNLDNPYWRIVERNQDINDHKLIKFSESEFCLFSSAPWMKYESMIYWYENYTSDPDFDIHEYIIEKGLKLFSGNIDENFLQMLEHISEFLDLNLKLKDGFDFNLYDHRKIEFIDSSLQEIEFKNTKKHYQILLSENKSFHIVGKSTVYCSNYSVNKIAWLAGTFIFQKYRSSFLKEENPMALMDSSIDYYFSYNLLLNFCSYFCSKVANPFVKCDLYLDLQEKRKRTKSRKEKGVLKVAMDILCDFKDFSTFINGKKRDELYKVSVIVGEILADTYYNRLEITEKGFEKSEFEQHVLKLTVTEKNIVDFIEQEVLINNLFKMKRKRYF